ncbi:MAG: YIP1 family protein [Deltaproteobacteria bacterium]|nr:YIP1 family protein [Deltaproteobacteria bacterium]
MPDRVYSEWERSYRSHPLQSFVLTAKEVIVSPVPFFKRLGVSDRIFPVVLYAVITQTTGALLTFGYQVLILFLKPALFGLIFQSLKSEDIAAGIVAPVVFGLLILFLPIFSLVGTFLSSALNHLILWILKGTKNDFTATLNAVAYASTAQLFLIVPFVGGLAAGVYQMVLLAIGLKELHDCPWWKSIMTVLIPVIVCCLGFLFLIGLLAAVLVPLILKAVQQAG